MRLTLNDQDVSSILERGSPVIEDPLESPCRRLKFKLQRDHKKQVVNYLGQTVTLEVNGAVWFEGIVMHKGKDPFGRIEYTVNDPLFYLGKNPGDYVYSNQAGENIIRDLAEKSGVAIGSLESMGVVFPALHYRGKEPHTIALDIIARTVLENDRRFWFRYVPGSGLMLYERHVPTTVWVFEKGVNLTDAAFAETIENQATRVTLVNRETGEIITLEAENKLHQGNVTHFEEISRTGAGLAESADFRLEKLSKVETTMRITGINPGIMPMFWSGDAVYIQEPGTGIAGGYYLKNVTQNIINDSLILISADVVKTLELAEIKYEDAGDAAKKKAKKGRGSKVSSVIERYF